MWALHSISDIIDVTHFLSEQMIMICPMNFFFKCYIWGERGQRCWRYRVEPTFSIELWNINHRIWDNMPGANNCTEVFTMQHEAQLEICLLMFGNWYICNEERTFSESVVLKEKLKQEARKTKRMYEIPWTKSLEDKGLGTSF